MEISEIDVCVDQFLAVQKPRVVEYLQARRPEICLVMRDRIVNPRPHKVPENLLQEIVDSIGSGFDFSDWAETCAVSALCAVDRRSTFCGVFGSGRDD